MVWLSISLRHIINFKGGQGACPEQSDPALRLGPLEQLRAAEGLVILKGVARSFDRRLLVSIEITASFEEGAPAAILLDAVQDPLLGQDSSPLIV